MAEEGNEKRAEAATRACLVGAGTTGRRSRTEASVGQVLKMST